MTTINYLPFLTADVPAAELAEDVGVDVDSVLLLVVAVGGGDEEDGRLSLRNDVSTFSV